MSLRRSRSITAILRQNSAAEQDEQAPSGPMSGPSSIAWRRQRLLNIGAIEGAPSENSPLSAQSRSHSASYGTLPIRRSQVFSSARGRKPSLPPLLAHHSDPISASVPVSPHGTYSETPSTTHSPTRFSFRELRGEASTLLRGAGQRPISAYDAPLVKDLRASATLPPAIATSDGAAARVSADVSVNGIRVWYSSFTSVDWLHDALKDAVRRAHLHRRKSARGKLRLILDRSLGWVIVSVVGCLTAIVAFLVIRSEQLLFDLKEGYCVRGLWKARRFCCAVQGEDVARVPFNTFSRSWNAASEEVCDDWRTWAEVFGSLAEKRGKWVGFKAEMVEYVAYACIALTLAALSSLLTIHLTASNTFTTRKDSGALSANFEPKRETDGGVQLGTPRRVMFYAAGSGIPEIKTILSGFVIHGYLGGRTLFTKSLGLALSVASGLSLGKEGPFVHIASCVGNIVSRFFAKYENNEGKRREILSAACAAGVAVAFGAPIGGVLFSLEEVSYYFPAKVMWRSFFCAMVAAITLRMLDPFGTGKLVLFQVTYDKDWHAYELLPFLFLGVFGGVYGAYFSKLNIRWSREVRSKTWMKSHPVWEVIMITFVTTLLCFLNPYTRMGGTELVYNLFAECRTGSGNTHSGLCILDPPTQAWPVIRAIGVALVVKGALTIVTFGIKVPAGIFIPTLGVGACAGRILGILVQWFMHNNPDSVLFKRCNGDLDCVIPGLYAMVGAAATLSGVTRTTVSLAVIMFELTDTLTYVVPLMLSVLVAKTVADALEPKGIYDLVIEMNKLPFLDAKHDYLWGELEIRDVIDRDVPVIKLEYDNTVKTVRDQLIALMDAGYDDGVIPVLHRAEDSDDYRLTGVIGASELEHALSIVADEADSPVYFNADKGHAYGESSISSLVETSSHVGIDPFDFSVYLNQAPLTVSSRAPLELVHQFFSKLGAKYVVTTDVEGYYEGIIDKKAWLALTTELEKKSH